MSPAETTPQNQSTGPRTSAGKARSAMNAMRHGLTGRVVVLPSEDMNIYRTFCKELMEELAPESPMERQYAQTFCDTQWRLNRARSYEDNMLALGHHEHADSLDTDDPQSHAALIAAKVFRDNSKVFVNLSLYEQRLTRQQKEALRQLEELQTKRRAAAEAKTQAAKQAAEAEATRNPNKMIATATPEFVFSPAEIEREATRPGPRPVSKNARSNDNNLPEAA